MSELPAVERTFILSGQAKLEVKPIAILGAGSVLAAQASGCANEQGRFWEYHDILYANQKSDRRQQTTDDLKKYAAAAGLDMETFNPCLDSGKYATTVSNDTEAAKNRGVTSTPTMFVNGHRVETTADAVGQAIREELASGPQPGRPIFAEGAFHIVDVRHISCWGNLRCGTAPGYLTG